MLNLVRRVYKVWNLEDLMCLQYGLKRFLVWTKGQLDAPVGAKILVCGLEHVRRKSAANCNAEVMRFE